MSFAGIIIGATTFFCIGIFHPIGNGDPSPFQKEGCIPSKEFVNPM